MRLNSDRQLGILQNSYTYINYICSLYHSNWKLELSFELIEAAYLSKLIWKAVLILVYCLN